MVVPSPQRETVARPANNVTALATLTKYLGVKAVAATAPDSVNLTAASTDVCIGVLAETIADQGRGDMYVRGRVWCQCSGAIAAGVRVAFGASGLLQAAVSGDYVIGTSVDAALANLDIIAVEINIPGSTW
jgi:hypothetical protein